MFTGLVEGVGVIVGLTPMAEGLRLAVKTSFPASELTLGESVAIAGACLTVVALDPPRASFEVSPETLACTTFPLKKVGDRVNLERAVRLGDRLGGHLVTGHVDGVGVVRELRPGPAHTQVKFELPGRPEPLRHREGLHRRGRGLPDREPLHGKHLYGERHPASPPKRPPWPPSKWATGSTWRRISSASTWPGCWVKTAPGAKASPRSCWPGTDFYE